MVLLFFVWKHQKSINFAALIYYFRNMKKVEEILEKILLPIDSSDGIILNAQKVKTKAQPLYK